MSCPSPSELAQFGSGGLTTPARAEVQLHLDGCPACRQALAEINGLPREPTAATADLSPASPLRHSPSAPPGDQGVPLGSRVSRYVIDGVVGSGGMGKVYSAVDPELNRRVALKLLLTASGSDASSSEGRARMLREAQALAQLSHPNVVAIYDAGEHQGQVFLAMELVKGVTVRDWRKAQPRTWKEVVAVFRAAGAGLAAAHDAGLVHRDFKAVNVLVGDDRRVRVLDFGLARSAHGGLSAPVLPSATAHSSLDTPLTREGSVSGTSGYIAPEIYRGLGNDARSDQFSFCVALFDTLFGRKPFTEQAMADTLAGVAPLPAPEVPTQSGVPSWVTRVIARGLLEQPEARFASMHALLAALDADPAKARARAALVAGVAVALGLAGVGGAGLLRAPPRVDCSQAARQLDGAWDPTVSGEVQRAFAATGTAGTAEAFERVRARLDPWSAAWSQQAVALCEAQKKVDLSAAAQLVLEQQCLEHRRRELAALTAMLRTADARMVSQAERAARLLTEPQRCHQPAFLAESAAPIADPRLRVRADELETKLDQARAQFTLSRYAEATATADPIVLEAADAGLTAVQTRALNLQGDVATNRSNDEAAVAKYTDALALAQAFNLRVELFGSLSGLAGSLYALGRKDEADRLVKLAHATFSTMPESLAREAELAGLDAMAADAAGNFEQALALRRTMYELRVKADGPDHPRALNALLAVSYALGNLDDLQASSEFDTFAIEQIEKSLGPNHPLLVQMLCNGCVTLTQVGDFVEGQARCERGLAIERSVAGDQEAQVAGWCEANLAANRLAAGDLDGALAAAERAVAADQEGDSTNRASALLARAGARLARKDLSGARADLDVGLPMAQRLLPKEDPSLADAFTLEAELELAQNRPLKAVAAAEKALALRDAHSMAPDRAETREVLAQALWATRDGRARALEQARLALSELAPYPGHADRRARLTRLLQAH